MQKKKKTLSALIHHPPGHVTRTLPLPTLLYRQTATVDGRTGAESHWWGRTGGNSAPIFRSNIETEREKNPTTPESCQHKHRKRRRQLSLEDSADTTGEALHKKRMDVCVLGFPSRQMLKLVSFRRFKPGTRSILPLSAPTPGLMDARGRTGLPVGS